MSTIWQTINKRRKNLAEDIKAILDAAGASDWLGPKEYPIILKPNLVVSKPASSGATTTPEVTAGLIEFLQDQNYFDITIAEGSWVGDSTFKAFKTCGYTDLSRRYGINLIDLQKDSSQPRSAAGDELLICSTIAELEENGGSLINIPVLKGHGQTYLTCALKNLKGCIPDSEKRRYHSLGVHNPVALLNTVIKPAFTLVDGLNGDPYWEEGGSPEKRDLLLLGRDSVSIDSYACSLLNIPEGDVCYIGIAETLGVGQRTESINDVIILGEENDAGNRPEKQKEHEKSRAWIEHLTDQRSACSACFGNLASALRELKISNPTETAAIPGKSICIGQNFRGRVLPAEKKGIGICTSGSETLGGCPPSVQSIKNFLLQ